MNRHRYRFTVKQAPTFRDFLRDSVALLLIFFGLLFLHSL